MQVNCDSAMCRHICSTCGGEAFAAWLPKAAVGGGEPDSLRNPARSLDRWAAFVCQLRGEGFLVRESKFIPRAGPLQEASRLHC